MNYERFIQTLPSLYHNWGTSQVSPLTENADLISPLLSLALQCLSDDEIYCQIGSFPVTNIIGALLNNPDKIAYLIDDIDEELIENLSLYNVDEQIIFFNQDCESFFHELKEIDDYSPIGVYFYNNNINDYRSQLLGLLLASKFLAGQAIIIINNSNYAYVQQAIGDFLVANSSANLFMELPNFGNGLYILGWDIHQNYTNQNDLLYHIPFLESLTNFTKEFEINQINSIKSLEKEAMELHFNNQFALAEEKYTEILNLDKYHALSYHNLAMIYYAKELYFDAAKYVKKALEISDNKGLYYYSLGLILQNMGNIIQAMLAYEQAIKINPQSIDSYNNLGNILVSIDELELAVNIYEQAIKANPQHFGSYINLGNVFMQQNKINSAIEIYQKAIELEPNIADTYYNLAMAFAANNNSEKSAFYLNKYTQMQGDNQETENNSAQSALQLGKYAYIQNDYEQVIFYYEKILDQKQEPDFYIELGGAYKNINNINKAIEIYQKGIDQHPESLDLHLFLSMELPELDRTSEAIALIEKICNLYPDDLMLRLEKSRILPVIYDNEEEINLYRGRFETEFKNLVNQITLDTEEQKIKALKTITLKTNFYFTYQGKKDLEIFTNYGDLVYKIMSANYPQWIENRTLPSLTKQGKIKVGYVSNSLRFGIGSLFVDLFKYHNKEQFEIYTYYTYPKTDAITNQCMLNSDYFYRIPNNLEKIVQQIIDDQLHILVFIELGLIPVITQIASLKLAPIQCQMWGHPVTSGLPTMDYFLSSDIIEAENAQEYYREKLIRLPNLGISIPKPESINLTKKRHDFPMWEDKVLYLCRQSLVKYLPQYDYIFPAIAQQVPNALFLFLKSNLGNPITEKFTQRLKKAFTNYDLDFDKYCVILDRVPRQDYMNLISISDVFLDSFIFSGGLTTLDAIAYNLPVVTCVSDSFIGRQSYGFLKMLGVTETVTYNEMEYINMAVRLGLDKQWRNTIREKMINNQHNLYDDVSCVLALEKFYQSLIIGNN